MGGSRTIVVIGLVFAAAKLLLIPLGTTVSAEFLAVLTDLALTVLIASAAWRASRRSFRFARALWLCVACVAVLWVIQFAGAAIVLRSGIVRPLSALPFPEMVITSFPFALALVLPLFVSEDRERSAVGWPQALDIAQIGILVFSAFLVFVYIPFLHVPTEAGRTRYLIILHLVRDSFLALGYVYRGWHARFSDSRRLQLQMSVFLALYGIAPLFLSHAVDVWQWPQGLADFLMDLPAVFLLSAAATWRQEEYSSFAPQRPQRRTMLWAQLLALTIPLSVVALSSRVPNQFLRTAWIPVTASFVLYAIRLFVMQHRQEQTLDSLAAMEEKFSKAFRSSPAAITIERMSDGTLIDVNDRALQIAKLKREEMLGRTLVDLGVFESAEDRNEILEILRRQGSIRAMPLSFRRDGRSMDLLFSSEVIELGGEPLIISSTLDVSELNRVTQQLQQAQKMELIGTLAGGVAHDFNNLLTLIAGHSALALATNPTVDLAEHIRQIKEASGKAANLTKQLLAFSRRQILKPQNLSLNVVVASIENLLGRTMGNNITLAASYAPDLGTIYSDPVQMEQVVMNLALNARDAMPQGGKLYFETKNLDLALPFPEKRADLPAGRYVMVTVADTGTGIRPEDMDRIFEPFFTTKPVGIGTGLGLSTVYGIVKQSGGHIRVSSELGKGTTFKIYLPRVESPPEPIQLVDVEPANLTGQETVLVVDDDARVCELTANILGQYGYNVIVANSPEDARRSAQSLETDIHLLITDVVMPDMSGMDLAQELKSIRPNMRVLYLTAYPRKHCIENSVGLGKTLLPKPFSPIELARHTRTALNAA